MPFSNHVELLIETVESALQRLVFRVVRLCGYVAEEVLQFFGGYPNKSLRSMNLSDLAEACVVERLVSDQVDLRLCEAKDD